MIFRNNPVIILAAGEGKRMGSNFDHSNKALIPVFGSHTVIDILLYELIIQGVSDILIIAGYRFERMKEYIGNLRNNYKEKPLLVNISDIFNKTNIRIIKAQDNYQNGPLFTLLTLKKYCPDGDVRSNIPFSFKNDDYLTIIPGDTLYDLILLREVLTSNFIMNSHLQDNFCHLFCLNIPFSDYNQLKRKFLFEGVKITRKFENIKEKEANMVPKIKNTNDNKIQIPIAIITKDFLNFAGKIHKKDVNTISKALDYYYEETGHIVINKLNFHVSEIPPFMDIDTKKVYDKTVKIITSFITEKK